MPPTGLKPAADLHNHLGASVRPSILWSIAHRQGIRLPTKNYWEFEDMITMTGTERNRNLRQMHDRFFRWTELIQSSPEAIEESVKSVISGGYIKSNVVLHELRFNPMKRNRSGERDLDLIILSALWGMERALLEHPQVRAGIILMMDRTFSPAQNAIIVDKAIRYRERGVIGVDLGGPNRAGFDMRQLKPLFAQARRAGLGITVHTGEEGQLDEMHYVVREIRPDRIGHGVECHRDAALLKQVVRRGITLELCPTSNLRNSVFADATALKAAYVRLRDAGATFAICTDGPEMYHTRLHLEKEWLQQQGILTKADLVRADRQSFRSTFLR